MIVVDTSALVAIVLGEEAAERILDALRDHEAVVSAVSWVEAQIVVEARQGPDAARDLQLLVEATIDHIVPVDEVHAGAAVSAWRRFGKGRHPAALNFGDCFAYALARLDGVPLLFKGGDFAQTDVESLL
jgi:ribonuclease VapC